MKSCLIVDDSRVIRKVARQILENLGFVCEEAEDGQQALDACKKKMPDVVLLDWNMPIMSGIDCIVVLRKMPNGEKPAVLFCTTENSLQHIQDAMAAGANEYIMKPFDAEIISSKFAQLGLISA